MTKRFLVLVFILPWLLAACDQTSSESVASSQGSTAATSSATPKSKVKTPQATMGPTTSKAISPLGASNSTIDCSGWNANAKTELREQAAVRINGQDYQVATFACASTDGELSTEFVESFVLATDTWASNGLVSGTDVPFITAGACQSTGSEVRCPVKVLVAGSAEDQDGTLVIYELDGGLGWRVDLS